MKFQKVKNNIFLVTASRYKLAKLFCRFQEHYESPKFKDKIFTLDELKEWYSKGKKFTYYSDWAGFNVPGYVFKQFFSGSFNPLSKEEKWLLDQIVKANKGYSKSKSIYVIGATNKTSATFNHELSHATFGTNIAYKNKVIKILSTPKYKKLTKSLSNYLKKIGYHKSVFLDEIHAYIMNDRSYLQYVGVWKSEYDEIRWLLLEEFNKWI